MCWRRWLPGSNNLSLRAEIERDGEKRPIWRPISACFVPSGYPPEVNGSELPFRLLVRRANQGAVQSLVCEEGVREVKEVR